MRQATCILQKILWLTVTMFSVGCGERDEIAISKKQHIDNLIRTKDKFAKVCHQDSAFETVSTDKIDTAIRTFFCDTLGNIYLIRRTFSLPKADYWTFFSDGKVIKVLMYFSTSVRREYYVDQDSV